MNRRWFSAPHPAPGCIFCPTLARQIITTRVLVQNCNGLGRESKRKALSQKLRDIDVALLQETHFTKSSLKKWPMSRARSVIAGFGSSQAKGVAIVGKKNTNLTLESSWEDRIVHGKIDSAAGNINVVSVYAPNITAAKETHRIYSKFLGELRKILDEVQGPILLAGDLNIIMDPILDTETPNPKSFTPSLVEEWDDLKQAFGLYDVQRQLHPEERLFTFAPGGENVRGIFRRLDYVLCSKEILDTVEHIEARTYIHFRP
jgi:exonuclease III